MIEWFFIARITTIGQSFTIQVCRHLLAGGCEKRTNNPVFTDVRHSRQPRHTRPTQHPHEYRFRLVIGGMTDRNAISPYLVSQFLHKVIPRAARRGLKRWARLSFGQHGSMDDKRQVPFPTEGGDKRFVTAGLRSAQPIVTMDRL